MPSDSIEHVYDLCCDHGIIGMAISKTYPNLQVTFVDKVPSIINNLRNKLTAYITLENKFQILCKDATKLKVNANNKNLFIVSGIGGELATDIFNNLYNQDKEAFFIFCIHQKNEYLKEHLIEQKFQVIKSGLVIENNHGYEIMLVHPNMGENIIVFDCKTYDQNSINHKNYLINLKDYYELKCKHEENPKFRQYFSDLEAILASF